MSETEAKTTLKNDVRLVSNQESASAVAVAEGSGAQSSTTVKELVVGENVTAVVTKAKRAATFLWTLLHAQVRDLFNIHYQHRFCVLHFTKSCTGTTKFQNSQKLPCSLFLSGL
jgi:hypothetical protein